MQCRHPSTWLRQVVDSRGWKAPRPPPKNITNKGVAWRGVSDTLLTLNGILKRTSSVWRQLFHCLVFRVGEMGEFTHSFRHNPKEKFGYMYITWQTLLWYIQGIHKRMVRFQKLTRNLFLTLHGTTYTVSSGNCPSFSCATSSSLLMLTAGPRGQFPRWRRSRKRFFCVLRFEVSRSVITVQCSARFRKDAPCTVRLF